MLPWRASKWGRRNRSVELVAKAEIHVMRRDVLELEAVIRAGKTRIDVVGRVGRCIAEIDIGVAEGEDQVLDDLAAEDGMQRLGEVSLRSGIGIAAGVQIGFHVAE